MTIINLNNIEEHEQYLETALFNYINDDQSHLDKLFESFLPKRKKVLR